MSVFKWRPQGPIFHDANGGTIQLRNEDLIEFWQTTAGDIKVSGPGISYPLNGSFLDKGDPKQFNSIDEAESAILDAVRKQGGEWKDFDYPNGWKQASRKKTASVLKWTPANGDAEVSGSIEINDEYGWIINYWKYEGSDTVYVDGLYSPVYPIGVTHEPEKFDSVEDAETAIFDYVRANGGEWQDFDTQDGWKQASRNKSSSRDKIASDVLDSVFSR